MPAVIQEDLPPGREKDHTSPPSPGPTMMSIRFPDKEA